jgi:hypothetical protein
MGIDTKPGGDVAGKAMYMLRNDLAVISPSGGQATAYQAISKNAQAKSAKVLASRLTPVSTNRYFRGVFFPSVTYSLPVNTIPENKPAKLQSQTYRRFLPKLGYNRNMPAAVVHGPSSLGGLDM